MVENELSLIAELRQTVTEKKGENLARNNQTKRQKTVPASTGHSMEQPGEQSYFTSLLEEPLEQPEHRKE